MKRVIALLCVLAVLAALCCSTVVFADDVLNLSIYRVNDYADILTDEEQDRADERFVDFAQINQVDLVACFLEKLSDSFTDLQEFSDYFFEHNQFGYGEKKDGILLVIDLGSSKMKLTVYGEVKNRIPEAAYDQMTSAVLTQLNNDGINYNTTETLLSAAKDYLNSQTDEPNAMPDWYPANIDAFQRTHGENLPLVRDDADIFTPEQEAEMVEKIAAIRTSTGFDLVVFTDVSSHDLSRGVYAADYYFFNGYGMDEEYSGSVLFICMESGNRGWWTAATGKCQSIYTESVINWLDDQLEPYMIAGRNSDNSGGEYGMGVLNYLDNVAELYVTPDWFPSDPQSFMPFHNDPSTPRVVDYAGLLTAEEEAALEAEIASLREKYDADFVILTDTMSIYRSGAAMHADEFYYYNGYGVGEDFKGVILCICQRSPGARPFYSVRTQGFDGDQYENEERMSDRLEDSIYHENPDVYKGAERFLHDAERICKSGRAPRNIHYKVPIIAALIAGLIAGLVTVLSLRAKMKTVAAAAAAQEYIVPGSFKRRELGDMLVNVVVTKTAKPKSSSSGGGGSSYSGSYSSSGGGSFSGGGRSF
ncbi:MAG: TPM domain-containing protein [Oscillospiraceae bacterium]|nr:TPM domain-containing protein [Oscillospiraceae bacterium]